MSGYRGYISSRPGLGRDAAQHVQNLVVRDYAARRDLRYLLSATEYAMPGCFMILEQVLDELPALDGIIVYSLFMLPVDPARRQALWTRVIGAGKSIHFALEGLKVEDWDGAARIEDIWLVAQVMPVGPKES